MGQAELYQKPKRELFERSRTGEVPPYETKDEQTRLCLEAADENLGLEPLLTKLYLPVVQQHGQDLFGWGRGIQKEPYE